jgi:hypothetical protein
MASSASIAGLRGEISPDPADRGFISDERPTIPRGKYIGKRIDPRTGKPMNVDETEHFYRCSTCGGWVDRRDLGQVFDHEAATPHPVGDKPQ